MPCARTVRKPMRSITVASGTSSGTSFVSGLAPFRDSMGEPKPPWRERKERYIQHIASADADIRLVSAADKFSNAQAILADLRAMGDKLWDKFKAGKDDQLWYYRSLVDAFAQGPHGEPGECRTAEVRPG